jgi:hypothetical protein
LREMKDRLNALPKNIFNERMTPYGVNHGIA